MVENSFFIGFEWWNRAKYLTWLSRAKRQLQRRQSGCSSSKCEWIVVIEHFCQLGWAHWSQELDLILKKRKKMNWLHCKKIPHDNYRNSLCLTRNTVSEMHVILIIRFSCLFKTLCWTFFSRSVDHYLLHCSKWMRSWSMFFKQKV